MSATLLDHAIDNWNNGNRADAIRQFALLDSEHDRTAFALYALLSCNDKARSVQAALVLALAVVPE